MEDSSKLEPTYMNDECVAKAGHIVMVGSTRAVVIGIKGTFVTVRGIGVKDTGEIVELQWVNDLPASQCVLLYESLAAMFKELGIKE
jgi:hypothetical protein